MKVKVKQVLDNGRHRTKDELKKLAPIIGELRIGESKIRRMNRTTTIAAVYDQKQIGSLEIIEPLFDAKTIFLETKFMRICGIEEHSGMSYYQIWDIEML